MAAVVLRPPPAGGLEGPIERIAVFRALMLGDLMCAVPALRALRHAFPAAQITLISLPWARALAQRLPYIDDFIDFPGWPGLPESTWDARALPDFLAQVQARRFDLAIQMHGSGLIVNPLMALLGARRTAGFFDENAWRPQRDASLYEPWPKFGHEIERLLALVGRLGAPSRGTQLEFPLRDEDRDELAGVWPGYRERRPYVVVHAGAQMPSRRWLLERFAEVADRLVRRGFVVVLAGGKPETELVDRLEATMREPAVNVVGRTTIWTLGALVEGAEHVVCNDTGVSHLAAALRRPSVVVSCGAEVARWAPLDRARHAVLWRQMSCRPCCHVECPIGHDCATAIDVPEVMQALDTLEAREPKTAPMAPVSVIAWPEGLGPRRARGTGTRAPALAGPDQA